MTKLTVSVKPNSKKEGVDLLENGTYRVRVNAPPIEGRANERVIELLAKFLGKPKSALAIVSGERGKRKIIALG